MPVLYREFYTINQLAELLEVAEITVRRMVRDGQITFYRIGSQIRINRADVENYLEQVRVER